MTFERLKVATSIVNGETRYFLLVGEWSNKREALNVQLADLPILVAAYKERATEPYEGDQRITLEDRIPEIRLRNAVEAACNSLYGMAEIAAQFANKVSRGELPSSFNRLRQRVRNHTASQELITALGDLQWYERVREARTEWAHYSTVFIGNDEKSEPLVVIHPYRRISDKVHFANRVSFHVADLTAWIQNAISTIDAFAGYLLKHHVLGAFDPSTELDVQLRDPNGFPVFHLDGRIAMEKTTIREFLNRYGIDVVDQ